MKLSNLRDVTTVVGLDKHRPHHSAVRIMAMVTVKTGIWPFCKTVDRPVIKRGLYWKFDDAIAEYPPEDQIERLWLEYDDQARCGMRLCNHY